MRLFARVLPVIVALGVIAVWYFGSASSTSLYFPPLQKIGESFVSIWFSPQFAAEALPSFIRVTIGLIIAIIVGVVVGAIIGVIRPVEPFVRPELEFLRALPPILIIPPMLLILGTGDVMEISVIALSGLWPILLATTDGVRAVETVRSDMGRAFRLPWLARMRWITIPTALPHIWSGVRAAVPIAIVVMVGAEYYSSQSGLGYFISQATTTFRIADMWSAILLLGLLGVILNGVTAVIGRLLDRRYGEYDTND